MTEEHKVDIDEVRNELNLNIDENNLCEEWQGQARLMLYYGTQLADAIQEESEAKARRDVTAANLAYDIRSDPAAFGLQKITETAIVSTIALQPEYATAAEERHTAAHKSAVLLAVVDALRHRKSALQGMTDLFLRQWYADPKSKAQPAELREAAEAGPPTKTIPGRRNRKAK